MSGLPNHIEGVPVEFLAVLQLAKQATNGDRIEALKMIAEAALHMLQLESSTNPSFVVIGMRPQRKAALTAIAAFLKISLEQLIAEQLNPDSIAESHGFTLTEELLQ